MSSVLKKADKLNLSLSLLSLETLKASFNVPSDNQGCRPDDFSISVSDFEFELIKIALWVALWVVVNFMMN